VNLQPIESQLAWAGFRVMTEAAIQENRLIHLTHLVKTCVGHWIYDRRRLFHNHLDPIKSTALAIIHFQLEFILPRLIRAEIGFYRIGIL
jgi:hypothetical protein